jgi:hypothetical protein
MANVMRILINGMVLKINKDAYLVEVEHNSEIRVPSENLRTVPTWAFETNAIWLSCRNASIFERAREGEKIKERLARMLSQEFHEVTNVA